MSDWILEAQGLHKTYKDGKLKTPVINGVDFQLTSDETVAIIGSSGSGKSTLLHLLGGLDTPSEGRVSLMGQDFSTLSSVKRGTLRNQYMGFIYQFHFLLPELTALENVMLPLRVRRQSADDAEKAASSLLDRVGLSHREHHKPSELSGGERQRVAIARALITQPACVLADEPTGNLDEGSANQVFELMLELNREMHTSIVMVTHDLKLASRMDRQLHISDGLFVDSSL